MLGSVFAFEVRFQLRRPSTWLYFGLLFLLAFSLVATDAVTIGGIGHVHKNSPFMIAQSMLVLTAIGQVITSALVGTAILRDFTSRTHELLFTTRMTRFDYLAGRFGGAFVVMLLVYLAIPIGMMVGSFMPWIDADKLGPFVAWHYLSPLFVLLIPNLFFIAAIFFAVGAITRNQFAIYTLGIVLLVGDTVASELRKSLDSFRVTALTDVFGMSTFEIMTRYWTMAEKNARTVPLVSYMLMNRAMCVGLGVALLAIAWATVRLDVVPRSLRRRRAVQATDSQHEEIERGTAPGHISLPDARRSLGGRADWGAMFAVARFTLSGLLRETAFVAIATIGVINVFMSAWYSDQAYDTKLYPVTYAMAETIVGAFGIFFLILITGYAGELVWRERQMKADQLVDALPLPSWSAIGGRLLALCGVLAVLLAVCAVAAAGVQAIKGYANFEIGLYVRYLYLTEYPSLLQLALLAFFVHALANNKYVGHFVMLVMFVGVPILTNLGFEHRLYQFGRTPRFIYSDMNGFGHFVGPIAWYTGYWLAFGLLLLVVASLFWVRGADDSRRFRMHLAAQRLTRRAAVAGGTFAALTLVLGAAIYHQSDQLEHYTTRADRRKLRASYERTFRRFDLLPQPKVTAVRVRADLVPERRAFTIGSTYTLVNRQPRAIDTIYVSEQSLSGERNARLDSLRFSRAATVLPATDTASGVFLYRLATPLEPGDSLAMGYGIHYEAHGFANGAGNTAIVANGTFINSDWLPTIGYEEGAELTDAEERKKEKLPPRDRAHPLRDSTYWHLNAFTHDADLVTFDATVSTAAGQIAIAPGYLDREYTENGRRVFHYTSDTPITKFFSFLSAHYDVRRDQWSGGNGSPPVDIQIFYYPTHSYNLDRMVAGVKASLDYDTREFGPYQFRQLRILEFPRYAEFAQSFPNTVPYSEGIGFITRVGTDDDDIDMPFFVTAHEVAHQWWGHQIVGADVQGAEVMSESLAEYSALMVMLHRYGPHQAQKFLRYELDRYLRGRSGEKLREQPLMTTENQQYIHYSKGSLVFYALADYIGEERLNAALRAFLHAPRAPGIYPTTLDLDRALRAATPDSLQSVVTDLFETITLFDDKTDSVTATKRPDGQWAVRLAVSARKLRADSTGAEKEVPVGDWIDVGVFGAPEKGNKLGKPLLVEKRHITAPHQVIELIVPEKPVKAGIDPYNKLIDREPKDNVQDCRIVHE